MITANRKRDVLRVRLLRKYKVSAQNIQKKKFIPAVSGLNVGEPYRQHLQ